jgi:Tol biopolymer transport system component
MMSLQLSYMIARERSHSLEDRRDRTVMDTMIARDVGRVASLGAWARRAVAGVVAMLLLIAVVAAASAAAPPAGSTVLISRPDGVGPAPPALDNASGSPVAVSGDGRYVAFVSAADGFAAGADARVTNVFVRDTWTGVTTLVSRSDGLAGAGMNASAAFGSEGTVGIAIEPGARAPDPPHGRAHVLVVFGSAATNLVDHGSRSIPPTGGIQQVWLRDVTAGTTYLVSRADGAAGAPGDGASRAPSITEGPHGPLIAFDSLAQNLGAGGIGNVFLRDANASQTLLVSCPNRDCGASGPQSSGFSAHPSIQFAKGPQVTQCPTGQQCALVAFETTDETLTGETGTAEGQIVLATALEGDTSTGAFFKWATVTSAAANTGAGPFGNDESRLPMLGPDGETVAYISNATNLVFPLIAADAGPQAYATIMTDAPTGFSDLVSGTPEHPQGASDLTVGGGAGVLIRFGFTSDSGELSGPNPFGLSRAYTLLFDGASSPQLLDRGSGSTGAQGDQDSAAPAISADGSTAVFVSRSHNLGAGPGIDFARVYARRLATDKLALVSRPSGTAAFATGVRESQIDGRAVSADGRYVAFESQSDGLAPGEDGRWQGVFVRDTLTGKTTLVSRATGANRAAADADSTVEAISDNGRRVLFNTAAGNLAAGSSGSVAYVRDLDANTTIAISRVNGADGTIVQGHGLDLSGDGNRVAFLTAATLDPDAGDGIHLYVRDLAANSTILADRDTGARAQPVDGVPLDASIDRDGQRVAWTSDERDSIMPTHIVVRLRDLKQNTTDLISRASAPAGDPSGGDPANADTADPRIDGNGNVVAFRSAATNLGADVTHQEIWVRNLATGQTVLASRASGGAGAPADADSQTPSLDTAGDRIVFTSTAGNLGNPSPSIFDAHSYLRDLSTGSTQLVSRNNGSGGAPAAQPGFTVVSLSGNGNCAAFSARSLTLGDGFASADFSSVHERVLRGQCPTPLPAPTVSACSPASGVAGTTVVTITGTNLAGASAVKFNGRAARISSDTATQIKATVPNGATTGKISVTTAGGTATSASSLAVTFTLSAISPARGPTGTHVTITGRGFTTMSSVKLNGVAARVLSRTPPNTLVAVVPAGASTGKITVTNTTAPIGTVTSANSYTKT